MSDSIDLYGSSSVMFQPSFGYILMDDDPSNNTSTSSGSIGHNSSSTSPLFLIPLLLNSNSSTGSLAMDDDSGSEISASSGLTGPYSSRSSNTSMDDASNDADQRRSPSPVVSVMSIDSDMELYRLEFDRILNNYSEVYSLPADEEEMQRLSLQHAILAEIIGERYSPLLFEALADENPSGRRKSCLDLGCGSGNWIVDVANDFPHVDAVGVDLTPMRSVNSADMPANLREVDDINLGLYHYFDNFDVVHARLVSTGVSDYHRMVDQLACVVRPGGLIELVEYDYHIYDVNRRRIEINGDGDGDGRFSWWAQYMSLFCEAVKSRGGDVTAATNLRRWVSGNSQFEQITSKEHWIPIVSVPTVGSNDDRRQVLEEKLNRNHRSFLSAGRPLLLGYGIPEPIVNFLEDNATEEIETQVTPQWARLWIVTARRKPSIG